MIDFTAWLIVGAITGWMSNSFIGTKERLPLSIIVGLVGALVAGIGIVPLLGIPLNPNNFSLQAILVALGGRRQPAGDLQSLAQPRSVALTVIHTVRQLPGSGGP